MRAENAFEPSTDRPVLARLTRSVYGSFPTFSARSGAVGKGQQRVDLTRTHSIRSWRVCRFPQSEALQSGAMAGKLGLQRGGLPLTVG